MKKLISLILLIGLMVSCKTGEKYTIFYPVYSDSENRYSIKKKFSEELKDKYIFFFKCNYPSPSEKYYKIEKGVLWVEKELYTNKELMANYTMKATDSIWIKESCF